MKHSVERKIRIEQGEQSTPKLVSKSWISIRDDNLRDTVYSKDIVNEDLRIFHGYHFFLHPARCTIFVNLSMKSTMAVNPFDSG